jgi:hypothetical protein
MKDIVVDWDDVMMGRWDDGRCVGVEAGLLDLLRVAIGLQNSHSCDHAHRWTRFDFQDMLIRGCRDGACL